MPLSSGAGSLEVEQWVRTHGSPVGPSSGPDLGSREWVFSPVVTPAHTVLVVSFSAPRPPRVVTGPRPLPGPLGVGPLGVGRLVVGALEVGPLGVGPLGVGPLGVGPLVVGPLGVGILVIAPLSVVEEGLPMTQLGVEGRTPVSTG